MSERVRVDAVKCHRYISDGLNPEQFVPACGNVVAHNWQVAGLNAFVQLPRQAQCYVCAAGWPVEGRCATEEHIVAVETALHDLSYTVRSILREWREMGSPVHGGEDWPHTWLPCTAPKWNQDRLRCGCGLYAHRFGRDVVALVIRHDGLRLQPDGEHMTRDFGDLDDPRGY